MKLLAWDTSTKAGTIAAVRWDKNARPGLADVRVVGEWCLNIETNHSDGLLWGIDQVLRSVRWSLNDVDAFGVGIGPGSFTGLRIGITTARTLAHTLKKPIVPLSSLAALARPAAVWLDGTQSKTIVVAATDACKGEIFALVGSARSIRDCVVMSDTEHSRPGLWKRGVEESVYRPEALIRLIKKKLAEGKGTSSRWIILGEARERYSQLWSELPAARRIDSSALGADSVQGRCLGMLAWEGYQAGVLCDALVVSPRYLRASDAEVKLKAGLLPAGPTRGRS